MTSSTALKIVLRLAGRDSHFSPAWLVNAHWTEVFPGRKLPETYQSVYHNGVETITDWWKAADELHDAAMAHLVERLDRPTL